MFNRLLEAIRRHKSLDQLIVSVRVYREGLERLVNLRYSYIIDNPDLAKLIVDNAFSADKIVQQPLPEIK
ncbi:hypothetical protein [Aeropyrum camini]|uniref:hypothetical protein n=1 Tax=Aeropyrum camini TaxID=229980 RepID=UPI0007870866|nr:hypothetical protein [Aeropyrum camini]